MPEQLQNIKAQELFDAMNKAAFEPLKKIVEYNKLEDVLTEDDIHLLVHKIGHDLGSWIAYLQHVKKQRNPNE